MKKKDFSKEFICRHVWDVLVKLAKQKKSVFYEDIRDDIFRTYNKKYACLNMAGILAPIYYHCGDNKLPHLTALVVSKSTGLPGKGFVAVRFNNRQEYENYKSVIFNYDWDKEGNPFEGYDSSDASVDSFAEQIVNHPDTSKEVWRKVKERGQCQKIFREGLLRAYNWRCAVCGFSFYQVLQAAHIKAYAKAEPSKKISINNGILLCPNHHALYDNDQFVIKDDYTIDYGDIEFLEQGDDDALKKYKGKKIALPEDSRLWPSKELLRQHKKDEV